MKLFVSVGNLGVGSSAITHLLSEFENVSNPSGVYEVRILYEADAVSDLEYNLVDNPHRYNTSNAIRRFKKYIDFNSFPLLNHHYEELFHGHFKELSYQYIDNLSHFKYKGYSHIDEYYKGSVFFCVNRCYKKIVSQFLKSGKNRFGLKRSLLGSGVQQYAGVYDRENFLKITKNYIRSLINIIHLDNVENLMIDQFLPATNISRYLRYIPDEISTFVFLVDRDPRDLFVTFKYFLHEEGIPCKTVKEFCRWFLWTRGQTEKQVLPPNVLKVQFEDLIYNYEAERNKILSFIQFENEISRKQTVFEPLKSINNTQVWKRYPQSKKEVEYIEKKLRSYCYPFEHYNLQPDYNKDNMFEC